MTEHHTAAEIRGDKQGKAGAVVGLILFILLLIVPLFFTTLPLPGQPGILVNLGMIDVGQGEENAPAVPASTPEVREEVQPAPPVEATPPPPPPPSAEPDPAPVQREVVVTETPQQVAIRKQKAREEAQRKAEAERKRREQAQANKEAADERRRLKEIADERQRVKDAEEARKRAAAEEADRKRKAAEEAQRQREAEAEATRRRVGGLLSGGEGRGNTGAPGNQGDPNGDPNADRLTGVSTGDGRVSGGLGGRGVLSSPLVKENSQRAGRVVVDVCVGPNGAILSASFTQAGSTTIRPQPRQCSYTECQDVEIQTRAWCPGAAVRKDHL